MGDRLLYSAAPRAITGITKAANPNYAANFEAQLSLDPTTGGLKVVLFSSSGNEIGTLLYPLRAELVGSIDSAIPDGADEAEGATTDAAVHGDTAGTVSAKLRGLLAAGDNYTTLIDYTTTASVWYVGKAAPGSSTSSAVWQIKRLTWSADGCTAIEYAGGSLNFTNKWTERVSPITYS